MNVPEFLPISLLDLRVNRVIRFDEGYSLAPLFSEGHQSMNGAPFLLYNRTTDEAPEDDPLCLVIDGEFDAGSWTDDSARKREVDLLEESLSHWFFVKWADGMVHLLARRSLTEHLKAQLPRLHALPIFEPGEFSNLELPNKGFTGSPEHLGQDSTSASPRTVLWPCECGETGCRLDGWLLYRGHILAYLPSHWSEFPFVHFLPTRGGATESTG